MKSLLPPIATLSLSVLAFLSPLHAEVPAGNAATVKKLVQDVGDALVKGDYSATLDCTLPAALELMGGKEKAMELITKSMAGMKTAGIAFKSFTAGEPGEFFREGTNTFVVVPVTLVMTSPDSTITSNSYQLGISGDEGKTWKFADGAGLQNEVAREKLLPKMPAALKLPAPQRPQVIKNL